MNRKSVTFAAVTAATVLLGAIFVLALGCQSAEQKSILDGVPQAARDAILKLAGTNEVTGIEVVTKDGVKMYAAEWMEAGEEVEVLVDGSGKLISRKVEEDEEGEESEDIAVLHVEEMKLAEAPAAVQQVINSEAGTYKSMEVDHLLGEEKEYFEAEIQRAEGNEIKIAVAVDGTVLGREEIRKVSLENVPEVVTKAILVSISKDEIEEIEEATSGGRKFYDVEFVKNGKEIKYRFTAQGECIAKYVEKESALEDEDDK